MPIQDFDGECFVAYTDISGFKVMMDDGERAIEALDHLYQTGFDILRRHDSINGFFFSDAGLLFARVGDAPTMLSRLLRLVRELNTEMLNHRIMLTTSIAWGPFRYHNRLEFRGINKTPVYGNAYVTAFLDNEGGKPKLKPGECRILKKNLPANVLDSIEQGIPLWADKRHHYYYWNLNNQDEIDPFRKRFQEAPYAGMLEALRSRAANTPLQ